MNSLSKKEKYLIYVLVICIFLYIYYSLFLNPIFKKIDVVKSDIKSCSIEVNKIRNAETIISNQKDEAESLKAALEEAFNAIPDTEKNPEIAYNLRQLGDINRVSIENLGFEEAMNLNEEEDKNTENQQSNNPQYSKIYAVPVTVEVLGDYNSIMNFISSIEKDTRISNISTVSINERANDPKLSGTVNMNYYYSDKITDKKVDYDFNTGAYGKPSLFN